MLNLGGSVLGFPSANVSSVSRAAWPIPFISFVLLRGHCRHAPSPGETRPCARHAFAHPVINAGDGVHQHPPRH
ncbi:MAG: hypothetical protein ACLRRT_13185 [Ruthenibacterium lactatiformans]